MNTNLGWVSVLVLRNRRPHCCRQRLCDMESLQPSCRNPQHHGWCSFVFLAASHFQLTRHQIFGAADHVFVWSRVCFCLFSSAQKQATILRRTFPPTKTACGLWMEGGFGASALCLWWCGTSPVLIESEANPNLGMAMFNYTKRYLWKFIFTTRFQRLNDNWT